MGLNLVKATDVQRDKHWRVLIYGKAGDGKTSLVRKLAGRTLILSLDNSYRVLDGAENIDIIPFDREHPSENMTQFLKEVDGILTNYDNLVIDNLTSFQSDWFVEQGKKSKNGITNELQHWNMWTNYFLRVLTQIYLKPVNIYVTAWEDTRELNLETGQIITQYVPQIRHNVLNQLLGLTDVVGRIQKNPKTGGRGIILDGSDGIYAKNRLDNRKACSIDDLFNFGDVNE